MTAPSFTLFSRDTNETQQALRQFQANPDWRQIAAFFLGWVFLSSVRHIWYACFTRETLAPAFSYIRSASSKGQDLERNQPTLFMRSDMTNKRHRSVNNFFALVLFIALGTSSLTQFFSLLLFGGNVRSLCSIVLALGLGGSVVARVMGLFALSLELRHRFNVRSYELTVFWFLLLSALGVTGGTIFFALGQTIAVPNLSASSFFLPTSLAASLSLIAVEAYTIVRILFALELSRGLLDINVRRAVALLIFDLAVLIPDALPTNVLGDFLPFSIGAVILLSAFASQAKPHDLTAPKLLGPFTLSATPTMPFVALEAPRSMDDPALNRPSPTPSQRAFHNSLMGVPALGVDPIRRLQRTPGDKGMPGATPTMPPLQIPQFSPLASKQLPDIPGHETSPRSDAATTNTMSDSRRASSLENAVLQTVVRRPLPASPQVPPLLPIPSPKMPVPVQSARTPRTGRIMSSQLRFEDQWQREHAEGLAPAPRPHARPQLYIDTGNQGSYLELNFSPTVQPRGDLVRLSVSATGQSSAGRARSKVSPAIMTPPEHRRRPLRSPARSARTVDSAPSYHPSFIALPFNGEETASAAREKRRTGRVSQAPTFGRRSRSTKHPNVPVTPEESPVQEVTELGTLVPISWLAQPVRPLRLVRGPRARPTPPSSAPPM
ncbi:hypothetical protein K488DRAFT_90955 [Vararia minispora EC-137]|uniref:Uncharacterized protein n=1 Tax=Vararia minispora EC-137 TaxID=1314806 RepID=A0ACB8Q6N8_9AGAM|nr:hypothetical protein K488DRAFT_90955 [Vararia minispora EC-137]